MGKPKANPTGGDWKVLELERDTSPHGERLAFQVDSPPGMERLEQTYSSLLHGTLPQMKAEEDLAQGSLPLHPQRNTRWFEASRASTFPSHTKKNLTQ